MNIESINALDEINKGACMGKDSITSVLDNVNDRKLKRLLVNELREYEKVLRRIKKIYPDKKPHETNKITKVMTYYGVQMRIMLDDSSSKIAELYLKGTNLGIIEGRKLLNNKNITKKVKEIIEDFVEMQEIFVEKLKCFL